MPSDRYTTGIYDANSGHLNPYQYTLGLGQAASRAGVRIFENSWVTKLEIAAQADADNRGAHRVGHGARSATC